MDVDPILSLLALEYIDSADFYQSAALGSNESASSSVASESASALQGVVASMSEDEMAVFDENGDGQLDSTELKELISSVFAQGKISQTLLDGLLLDTDNANLKVSLEDGTLTSVDSSATTAPENEALRIYNEKLEYANGLINNDEKIPDDLIAQRNENAAELAKVSEEIEKLNSNLANLTEDELAQLEALKARKEELTKKRDDIEKQILEVCSEDTKTAILELQEARNNVNAAPAETQPVTTPEVPATTDSPIADNEAVQETTGTDSSGGKVSGGGGGGGGGGDDKLDADTGGYENMSVEELKAELTKANGDLSQKKSKLSAIVDGSDSALSALKTTMDEAYKQYQEVLKAVAPELAAQEEAARAKLDAKQSEIDNKNLEISNQNMEISACQTNYDNATSTVSEYENIVSSLESAYSTTQDAKSRSEIASKLSSAKTALEKAKEQQTTAKQALDDAQAKLTTLKTDLGVLNSEKTELQTELTNVQTQITALNNQAVNDAFSTYTTAAEQYNSTKTTMTTDAQADVAEAQDIVNEIQTALNTKNNQAAKSEFSFSSLGGTYMRGGIEYASLLGGRDLDALAAKIQQGGAGNKWGHPDKCLSFAYSYGLWVDGSTKTPINGAAAGYPDASRYREFTGSKGAVLAEIKEQLDSGVAVVLQVGAKGNSRHYVTVVGYRAGAGSSITESDLLILDTYDGLIEGMGSRGSRQMITGKQTGRGRTYEYQIYIRR